MNLQSKNNLLLLLTCSIVIGLLTMSIPPQAHGQVEVEVDPIAYALNGYSGHAAYVFDPLRISLGAFGADQPEFFHGNEGWEARTRGITMKADYLFPKLGGFFVGLDATYSWNEYTLKSSNKTESQNGLGLGVRTGYRFTFRNTGFYIVPWFSVSYPFDTKEVIISDEKFDEARILVFPTIHLGWQF